ncbi:MAG: hypothetical protein ACHQ51_02095 [Elusimicrobiota bacterium]
MKRLIISALFAVAMTAVRASAQEACPVLKGSAPAVWTCLTGAAGSAQATKTVLRDPAAWRKFWTETTGKTDAPAVDFTKTAVAVEILDGGAFRAVKVAKDANDADAATALRADAAAAEAAKDQAAADERVGRMLAQVRAPRAADAGTVSDSSALLASRRGFDEAGLRDSVGAVPSVPRLVLAQATCTPGVDCPEQPRGPVRRPAPNCTPGVDCPGDGDQQDPSRRTPLPPNYRPRPSGNPSSFPPIGSPDYYDQTVTSGWYVYRNIYGWPEEGTGNWSNYDTARASVVRGGSEKGQQGSDYTANLTSTASRPTYRVYWRYVGTNCDPNDDSQCLNWSVQYARFVEHYDHRTASAFVDVHFNDNGQKILPWETETISLTFDGSRIDYDASYGAFRYSVNGPIINQQTGRASIEFTAGNRVRRQPESDKVIARLEKSNGQLQISVVDRRADVYNGEPLEIAYQVKKDCNGWFCSDKVVDERRANNPVGAVVDKGASVQTVIPVANTGPGKYYIVWSFRRAKSQYSNDGWVNEGKGDKIQF